MKIEIDINLNTEAMVAVFVASAALVGLGIIWLLKNSSVVVK